MHAFSQAALKFARIDLWGRSEPGNTHLILIERELRAGTLTPPGRVILRQCSSRRGKRSIDHAEIGPTFSPAWRSSPFTIAYDPSLDLQLTSNERCGLR